MSRSFASIGKTPVAGATQKMKIKYGKQPMLHIVDASNWMCRAYFATNKNPTYAKDGTPTYGLRQFMNMVKDLIDIAAKDPNGAYLAFCFDPGSNETWRYRAIQQWTAENKKKYVRQVFKKSSDYKGNRDRSLTKELGVQMKLARDILEMAGYYVGLKRPYECDDLVGTLSDRFKHKCLIKLYSRDKDYVQLVDHKNVELIMQAQSNAAERRFTLKTAQGFFGVPPDRVIDMLALSGDSVDNVPGIPGIGEKTAAEFINRFGGALELREALLSGELKSKAGWAKALIGEIPSMDIELQMELVTIDRNVPTLPRKLDAFVPGRPDIKALKATMKRLGLPHLLHV
ncbi:hypothetical protein MPK64_gp011 [Erwinia phage pEa_SNUABM_16]|uniref:5'-3' exonuclease domain-containing protein n=1 Tax=Erwinia phage pEa_SNUABM_16 TaxID=2869544 RepID=A0AAE8XQC7_9CAUD|nr:hypothetical protein MPK64_gp011 [Erwinia phage pEa_SNUABM_16]QZE58914.1 hypothetical protein pEaSNUABM18_00011 [Erwinia phage pEa_SNUABM_18]UAW96155.1 hypothetical protein pEaSNUABM16_00011 [Erwinia phage pEa_SNUABM_16]